MAAIVKVNKENYPSLKAESRPVLLDFYADWCGPCRMLAPVLDSIASERDDIVIAKVNVDDEPELAAEYGVISIPTLVALRGGEVVDRSVGARPKAQILSMLEG